MLIAARLGGGNRDAAIPNKCALANKAVGAGWLLCRWLRVPAPSALFEASVDYALSNSTLKVDTVPTLTSCS